MPRVSRLALATLGSAALLTVVAGSSAVSAQVDLPITTTTTDLPTTSTTRPSDPTLPTSSSTTSTTRPSGGSSTSSTAPPSSGPGAPPAGGGGGDPGAVGGGDSADAGTGMVPPEAQAMINSVKRTGSNNTGRLLDALRPLQDLGVSEAEAISIGFGRFPMGGYATYSHDWWFPRFVPEFHLHQGTDIFAALETPVRSPADGTVRITNGLIGGLSVYVTTADGTYYYLAHLARLADGLTEGQQVKVGDVVAFNGDSGNAKGGPPHIHFEVHPGGGGPVDPKPILDQWLAEALANVPRVIAAYEARVPRAVITTGLTRRLGEAGGGFAAPSGPSRSQLLWASSASPAGGSLRLAEAEAVGAARRLDWDEVSRLEEAKALRWQQDLAEAHRLLDPLLPPLVRTLFTG